MALLDIFKKKKTKKRNYSGASKGKRLSRWTSSGSDANAASENSLKTLRERSRDLRRNSPYGRRAIDIISANVIGIGISTSSQNENIDSLWKEWAGTTACDFDGDFNLKGLQKLAMDATTESGEVLIRTRVVAGLKFPYQYQVLEADFLDTTKTISIQNGNRVIQGIEFDTNGKLLGYHLYETHPGSIDSKLSVNSNFIPKEEIKHIFRKDRPGQVRGVPWLSPVMVKIKDLGDFEDAQLVKQRIAACFTAFVQDISADCATDPDAETGELGEMLEPGVIEELPPGKTVTFSDPPTVENYKEFVTAQVRSISIGLGLSFEAYSGDLTETNYSAGRMGHIEMGRNVDSWRKHIIMSQMLDPIVDDFNRMLTLMGIDSKNNKMTHTPPMRQMIDPTKEIPAMIKSVRAGLSSRSEMITSMGGDPNDVADQIAKDNKKADELGLILDSDARYTNISGKKQEVETDEKNQDQQE